jgi:hypothetical protein
MRKTAKPFRVALKFDLLGTFIRRADSAKAARTIVFSGRSTSYRFGRRIIPGCRLLYATITDERRKERS